MYVFNGNVTVMINKQSQSYVPNIASTSLPPSSRLCTKSSHYGPHAEYQSVLQSAAPRKPVNICLSYITTGEYVVPIVLTQSVRRRISPRDWTLFRLSRGGVRRRRRLTSIVDDYSTRRVKERPPRRRNVRQEAVWVSLTKTKTKTKKWWKLKRN